MSVSDSKIESFKSDETALSIVAKQWSDSEIAMLEDQYSKVPNKVLAERIDRSLPAIKSMAHKRDLSKDSRLVTRWKMVQSNNVVPDGEFGNYIRGLTDGEGSFNYRQDDRGSMNFRYAIELVDADKELLEEIKNFFEVGTIYHATSRSDDWSDSNTYVVYSAVELATVIIPFFVENEPLAPTKHQQFTEFAKLFSEYFELDGGKFKWVDRLDSNAKNKTQID